MIRLRKGGMTGAITFEFVAAACAILLASFAVWRWLEARFRMNEEKANMALKAVDQLRLEVMRDYASVSHLEKVETRLVTALDRLTDEVSKLRETWTTSPSRRSRKAPD